MKKLIEDWIVNEILDTLRQARISLLGITALDSPLELQRKTKENSTAITRRIEKVLDLIDPSKLSTGWTLEKEIDDYVGQEGLVNIPQIVPIARHFYALGRKIERTRLGAVMKEKAITAQAHPDDDELWIDLQGLGLKDNEFVKVFIIKEKNNG